MNLDITLSLDEYGELYAQACNAAYRALCEQEGIMLDDEFLHTSDEARHLANAVLSAIGVWCDEEELFLHAFKHQDALRAYEERQREIREEGH